MNVIFLSKYGYKGASSRYRFYNYRDYFTEFEFEFKPLLADSHIDQLNTGRSNGIFRLLYILLAIAKRFLYLVFASSKNLYIIEKELFPNVPYIVEKLLLLNKTYCLDYDDYVGAEYVQNNFKKKLFKKKLEKLVAKSKFTTVGNKWYFELFDNHPSLYYLPTNIDIEKYEVFKKVNMNQNDLAEFLIVWIGSKSTSKYLEIIKDPFFKLAKRYNVSLNVIGGVCPFNHPKIKHIKWEESTEIFEISKGDVGIMPLYDTLWEKGKCGFKLIQYMGVGLPVLASSSPANNEIIDNNGFICTGTMDWFEKLECLILQKELRMIMGQNSYTRAKNHYSYQKWGSYYAGLIKDELKKLKSKR